MLNQPQLSKSHGSPADRGAADSYYRRGCVPHYWPEGTGRGTKVERADMTEEQISEYIRAYNRNEDEGDHKEWY